MNRIEEFNQEGKNIMYIDFSGIKTQAEACAAIESIEPAVAKYSPNSLYTITNIESIRITSGTMKLLEEYLRHNKPYVICGVIIGLDGVKKMLATTLMKLSGRNNLFFAFSREKALELLLRQEKKDGKI